MTTKVQKWGNSLAVRIPKELADKLDLREGISVHFSQKGKRLEIEVVQDADLKTEWTLTELLAGIDPNNVHPETDWGPDVGKEILPDDIW